MSACRSCGAPIRWTTTAAGKAIPLDDEPTEDGNIQLGEVGGQEVAIVLNAADRAAAQIESIPLYVSHFATCPDANSWRK